MNESPIGRNRRVGVSARLRRDLWPPHSKDSEMKLVLEEGVASGVSGAGARARIHMANSSDGLPLSQRKKDIFFVVCFSFFAFSSFFSDSFGKTQAT